jgi:hypothetical protein
LIVQENEKYFLRLAAMIPVAPFSLLIWLAGPPRRGRPTKARQAHQGEAGPPRRGRPTKARQASDVPIAIRKSTGNASVYQMLSCFLAFTGAIADVLPIYGSTLKIAEHTYKSF